VLVIDQLTSPELMDIYSFGASELMLQNCRCPPMEFEVEDWEILEQHMLDCLDFPFLVDELHSQSCSLPVLLSICCVE